MKLLDRFLPVREAVHNGTGPSSLFSPWSTIGHPWNPSLLLSPTTITCSSLTCLSKTEPYRRRMIGQSVAALKERTCGEACCSPGYCSREISHGHVLSNLQSRSDTRVPSDLLTMTGALVSTVLPTTADIPVPPVSCADMVHRESDMTVIHDISTTSTSLRYFWKLLDPYPKRRASSIRHLADLTFQLRPSVTVRLVKLYFTSPEF